MLFAILKSVKTVVAEEAAVDVMAEVADTEATVAEAVRVEATEAVAKAEEILAHVKVADTKVTVTMPVEVEIAEILVHHVLQVAIEERVVILLLKKVHVKEVPNHALLVLHEAMLQELLVVKALQAALLNQHLETLIKKTNTLYSLAQNCASDFS